MLKKILSLALILMLVFTLSTQSIFAQGKGRPNKGNKEDKQTEEMKTEEEDKFQASDLAYHLKEMLVHGSEAWTKLPYGLSKKDKLPPGLEKLRLENRLPYGLAKRLEGYDKGNEDKDILFDKLTALIEEAELLLLNEAEILYSQEGINNLTESILDAKEILEDYDTSEDVNLSQALSDLKEAMRSFKLEEVLGDDAYAKLTDLYDALTIYGDLYFEDPDQIDADDEFYNAYVSLMTSLEDVLDENSEIVLTKALYNELMKASEVFKDHTQSLQATIIDAKKLLYVDLEADVMTYNYVEGTLPGTILIGSNLELKQAIENSESALEDLEAYDYQGLKSQKDLLLAAMETFKNNVFLGAPAIETLVGIEVLLLEYSQENPSDELTSLIDAIKIYTSVEDKYITKGNFDSILTQSQDYIDALFDGMKEAIETFISEKEAILAFESLTMLDLLDLEPYKLSVSEATDLILDEDDWTFSGLEDSFNLLMTEWQGILDEASIVLDNKVQEISLVVFEKNVEDLDALIEEINIYLGEGGEEAITLEGIDSRYANLIDLYEAYLASLESETTEE